MCDQLHQDVPAWGHQETKPGAESQLNQTVSNSFNNLDNYLKWSQVNNLLWSQCFNTHCYAEVGDCRKVACACQRYFCNNGKQTHKCSNYIYCYEQLYPTHHHSYLGKNNSMLWSVELWGFSSVHLYSFCTFLQAPSERTAASSEKPESFPRVKNSLFIFMHF